MDSIIKIYVLMVMAPKKECDVHLLKTEDFTKVSHQTSRGDFTVVTEMRRMIREHSPKVHLWFEVE